MSVSLNRQILQEGRNCWRILPAGRVAFLIDAEAYFSAFAAAAQKARQSILIAAWDIDSRIQLFRDGKTRHLPTRLDHFLRALASQREDLHIHILNWDFAMIYAFERELLPVFRLPWQKHKRIHFHMDGHHPLGASHHQKIVVVDDAVAFVGGLDLTKQRWDTPEHLPTDQRRTDPSGDSYGPWHDVQIAVEGEVASALGDLVRERWFRATGERVESVGAGGKDLWPPELLADLENVQVGIARTDPFYADREGVREVEALYLEAIASAQHCIYMENQYFTSAAVGKALCERLGEKEGPEIVLVLREKSDWLEESTMGTFRAKLLAQLREADRYDRLGVYFPVVGGSDEVLVNVHSKVMIVDDRFVRVGSSNLSNRSMGVDTECDLAIESGGQGRVEKAIAGFRNRLLAEHVGVGTAEIKGALGTDNSVIQAVEKLRGSERTLVPFPQEEISWAGDLVPDGTIDPPEPIDPEKLVDELVPAEEGQSGGKRVRNLGLILLALLALAVAWRWTPLGDWIDLAALTSAGKYLRGNLAAPFIVIPAYLVGTLIMFPVTLLIVATAFMFGALAGFFYAILGCLLAAVGTYVIGRALGRNTVSHLAGSRLNRLSRRLARHGVLAVTTVRIIPVAPFTVINLVAGASHIRFWDFVLGTVIGMAPGIIAITIFEHQLEAAIREPGAKSLAILAALAALIAAGGFFLKHWLEKRKDLEGSKKE
jgi:phospholipase D1/2